MDDVSIEFLAKRQVELFQQQMNKSILRLRTAITGYPGSATYDDITQAGEKLKDAYTGLMESYNDLCMADGEEIRGLQMRLAQYPADREDIMPSLLVRISIAENHAGIAERFKNSRQNIDDKVNHIVSCYAPGAGNADRFEIITLTGEIYAIWKGYSRGKQHIL